MLNDTSGTEPPMNYTVNYELDYEKQFLVQTTRRVT